ncbi:hypothetical protein GVN21_05060 [Caulobacter sp. SLTY]|uniref:hypothetical protein n=1 Tax=Caulobacter sp. SLTY TaxID=2683262 RepID=UPI00141322B5|nr:hypothetical protein [Caulobacter sp. SLTY]NBB14731.1 hypothetical protein [Caulobacter sp. SLTY]
MRRTLLTLTALGLLAGPALAAGGIALQGQNPLSETADAFPRIVNPAGPKIERINQALGRADARAKKAIKDCGKGPEVEFERAVTAPMTGQPFLTLVASDYASCGGAHPSINQTHLTYDLGTGRPINWAEYLPAELVKPETLIDVGDGSQLGAVQAPALLDFYKAGAKAKRQERDCDEVIDGADSLVLWIDAKAQGVAMQMASVPHAVQACNEAVVMKTDQLRKRGARPALTDAIDAAKKGKNWQ